MQAISDKRSTMIHTDRQEENAAQMRDAANETNAAQMHRAADEGEANDSRYTRGSSAARSFNSEHRAPIKHSKLRRKFNHDYSSPCAYLITVETTNRQRILGTLAGEKPDEARIEPTPLGATVIAAFRGIEASVLAKTGCYVQVIQYQLMPDHFHGILRIREALPKGWTLGKIIGAWKALCTCKYNEMDAAQMRDAADEKRQLFEKGYNDRPLVAPGQLQGWIAYLRDNPRRLWLKLRFPDRLRKEYQFVAGESKTRYTAVGNTFLLTYPERQQVRCHRRLSDEQIQTEVNHYLQMARTGVVLVSPFISPAEKAVYDACYKERLKMIRLVKRALDGSFVYPQGRDFEACVQGFLVVLSPFEEGSEDAADQRISRNQCLTLNDCAADLASSAERRICDAYDGVS